MPLIVSDLGRLYGILDLSYVDTLDVAHVVEEMIDGGVGLIQLRAKDCAIARIETLAAQLHAITSARGVPLIINDHVEVARSMGAEGVHVGQDDLSVAEVRKVVGRDSMVGKSTHSLEQAKRAVDEGADYIGFGPIFATPTKPNYQPIGLAEIGQVHDAVGIPIFCIGGIKLENLSEVIAAGARRVVIVSGLLQGADIASYARDAKKILTNI